VGEQVGGSKSSFMDCLQQLKIKLNLKQELNVSALVKVVAGAHANAPSLTIIVTASFNRV
jgi:hypothetical protein